MDYSVRSIERALNMLKCFNADRKEIRLLEFTELMSLNKSTVYRILVNLKNAGFVDVNKEGEYIIGNEVLRLASVKRDNDFLKKGAYHLLEILNELSGETVILSKYHNCRLICIEKIESLKVLKITSEIGVSVPIMKGATGKSIAAFLNKDEFAKCIEVQQIEFNQQYDLLKLKEELQVVRKNGYVLTTSEIDEGVTAFAMPIFGDSGSVIGSISIAGPDFRFNEEIINKYIDEVIEGVNLLSRKMGYIG